MKRRETVRLIRTRVVARALDDIEADVTLLLKEPLPFPVKKQKLMALLHRAIESAYDSAAAREADLLSAIDTQDAVLRRHRDRVRQLQEDLALALMRGSAGD